MQRIWDCGGPGRVSGPGAGWEAEGGAGTHAVADDERADKDEAYRAEEENRGDHSYGLEHLRGRQRMSAGVRGEGVADPRASRECAGLRTNLSCLKNCGGAG